MLDCRYRCFELLNKSYEPRCVIGSGLKRTSASSFEYLGEFDTPFPCATPAVPRIREVNYKLQARYQFSPLRNCITAGLEVISVAARLSNRFLEGQLYSEAASNVQIGIQLSFCAPLLQGNRIVGNPSQCSYRHAVVAPVGRRKLATRDKRAY